MQEPRDGASRLSEQERDALAWVLADALDRALVDALREEELAVNRRPLRPNTRERGRPIDWEAKGAS